MSIRQERILHSVDLTSTAPSENIPFSPERTVDYAEQRHTVERAAGTALTALYDKYSKYVSTKDERGIDQLTTHVSFHDKQTPFTLMRQFNEESGQQVVYMLLRVKGEPELVWRYDDGPDREPRLTPCYKDPDTSTVKGAELTDPENSDEYVSAMGQYWLENLESARSPQMPKRSARQKKLSGMAISLSRRQK
jgi:hypothetical protein